MEKNDNINIVIFGAPGIGKGTQSAKLIDRYANPVWTIHISAEGEALQIVTD